MKPYLTPVQIAELEHVTRVSVARWAKEGKFAGARKVGREYRIPIESYHEWKEKTKIEPVNERTDERTSVRSQHSRDN
jgi:excisionase family DNA binding protein